MSVPDSHVRTFSAARRPPGWLRSIAPIVSYPATMLANRYLIQNFFRRELLGRFRGSAMGIVWVLIHPLFTFAIYYLVFGILFGNVKTGQRPDPAFAIYLFSGVLVFNTLLEGTTRACTVVTDNGNLVKKVAFPSQLLPVHVVLIGLSVYLVGAAVCFTAGVGFGVLQPGVKLLLLPVVLLIQFVFTTGLGLLLATCHVFARDTSHLWGVVGMAWMFLTPVFWFPHQMDDKPMVGLLASALYCNPAYPLVQAHRIVLGAQDGLVDGKLVEFGDLQTHLLAATAWALAFLLVGYGVFMSRRHKFADLV